MVELFVWCASITEELLLTAGVIFRMNSAEYNTGFMPYGSRWRRHRRSLHDHFHPNIVQRYQPVQVTSARSFLRRLLETPERFMHHTRQ